VLAGKGHMQYFCGVPERIFEANPHLKDESMLIVTEPCEGIIDLNKSDE
jgi:hypothetical protein